MTEDIADGEFVNFGVLATRDVPSSETATIIVVGIPRSGTSMVASVLRELGIFIGNAIDNVVMEDRDLVAALGNSDSSALPEFIAGRNAQYPVWGFKRPEAYRSLKDLCRVCRNPRVIVTFRDILTIALRNQISMQMNSYEMLPRLVDQYRDLVQAVAAVEAPCLMISYEKAVQFPTATVERIAAFCGLELSEEGARSVSAVIENGTPRYLEGARLRYEGYVGQLRGGQLRGWAKALHRDGLRVNVVLELNGVPVQRRRADLHRPDVEIAGHGDGRYGFEFAIDDQMDRNAIVQVVVENSRAVLKNSGLPLSRY